jgi:hypothetical protein|tara:strand:+ start:56 stop:241 length:186 start_codon:yes stop_codon:yes gene_type:complete
MTGIRFTALVTGVLSIFTFIFMMAVLILVGKSVGDMYLACMLGSVPIGIGCIMGAYIDGDY